MAVDALCNLYTGSITATGSAGTAFDLKTMTPLEGLPVKIRINGGAATTTAKTLTISITASDDNFSTTAETLFSKIYTISTTANSSNFEDVFTIVSQHRYLRVEAPTFSASITTAAAISVDIVSGRHNP